MRGGFGGALDVAGGGPGDEDFGVALVDAVEDGAEDADAGLAAAEDAGNGGGGSALIAEGTALLA
ncbi:hypothetical protein [Luteolibacter sp.]|uniref:hypothetical protein n=1 Tax=Luteolibacter sp. TaxID=1962973 RepID=UPI003266343D